MVAFTPISQPLLRRSSALRESGGLSTPTFARRAMWMSSFRIELKTERPGGSA
jgi:hypothetical protein